MRLWTIAQPVVGDYINALVRDHSAAQDVLQETALVVFRKFAEYDENRPFVAWALGVARYQVLGLRRDLMRSPVVFDEEVLRALTDTWAEMAPLESEHAGLLRPCLARLPARSQHLVRLRYFEDLNAPEIARRLDMAAAAVRVALQRIREQLRACLEHQLKAERNLKP